MAGRVIMKEYRCSVSGAVCGSKKAVDAKPAVDENDIEIEVCRHERIDRIAWPVADLFCSDRHTPLANRADIDVPENEPLIADRARYFLMLLQPVDPRAIGFDRHDLAHFRPHSGKRAATRAPFHGER